MRFLEKNWFKVGILVLLTLFAFIYFDKEKSRSKTQSSDFNKKMECASHIESLKKRLIDSNANNPKHSFVDEVFYSPSYDTCFYSFTTSNYYMTSDKNDLEYTITDYTTNKVIFFGPDNSYVAKFESKKEELRK